MPIINIIPSICKNKSPYEPLSPSYKQYKENPIKITDTTIGNQMDENKIVSARIID
jgi:hypothetical protein